MLGSPGAVGTFLIPLWTPTAAPPPPRDTFFFSKQLFFFFCIFSEVHRHRIRRSRRALPFFFPRGGEHLWYYSF